MQVYRFNVLPMLLKTGFSNQSIFINSIYRCQPIRGGQTQRVFTAGVVDAVSGENGLIRVDLQPEIKTAAEIPI